LGRRRSICSSGYAASYLTSGYGRTIEQVDPRTGRVQRRTRVPYGSFNLASAGGYLLTSSLLTGTLTVLDDRLRVLRIAHVATSARDVAGATWP